MAIAFGKIGTIAQSSAMAANVKDRVWSLEELVDQTSRQP
jgi:hypothetical protein